MAQLYRTILVGHELSPMIPTEEKHHITLLLFKPDNREIAKATDNVVVREVETPIYDREHKAVKQ